MTIEAIEEIQQIDKIRERVMVEWPTLLPNMADEIAVFIYCERQQFVERGQMLETENLALIGRLNKAEALAMAISNLMEHDGRQFLDAHRVAVDEYIAICLFCGVENVDENNLEHMPDCAIEQTKIALRNWEESK